jgi:hypothetical protein
LIEDNIGDPIRYFLYPKSSGNRIREVFHLLNFNAFSKIPLNKIKDVDYPGVQGVIKIE